MINSIDITIGFLLIMGIGIPIEYCLLKAYFDWKDGKQKEKENKTK